jgi:hypothetical protein
LEESIGDDLGCLLAEPTLCSLEEADDCLADFVVVFEVGEVAAIVWHG